MLSVLWSAAAELEPVRGSLEPLEVFGVSPIELVLRFTDPVVSAVAFEASSCVALRHSSSPGASEVRMIC